MKECDILPIAVSPIGFFNFPGYPEMQKDPVLIEIAKEYNKTPIQVALNWGIKRGCALILKSCNEKHLQENMDIYDFDLDIEDMERIDQLNKNLRINNKFPLFNRIDIFA